MSKRKQHRTKTAVKPKQDSKERNELGLSYRAVGVTAILADCDSPAEVRMSVSSAEPVLTYVYFNERYQQVYEILDHSEKSIKRDMMQGGLVIQDTHYGDQIGLIREPKLENGKLGGIVEFCTGERAQEIAKDAEKELRTNSSVGYTVDTSSYVLEGEHDGIPVVRAMSWTPYEASFVNVPADTSVGVGRELTKPELKKTEPKEERNIMNPNEIAALFTRGAKFGIEASKIESIDMTDNTAARAALDSLIVEKQSTEIESRGAEIQSLKERKPELPEKKERAVVSDPAADIPKEDMRRYSVMNAVRSLAGMRVDVGLETEISDELAKQRGRSAQGLIIPHAALAKRDFTVSGTSGYSVSDDLLANEFIDVLRPQTVLAPLGVNFLSGLVGDVAIPKMTAGGTGYWVAESVAITESAPTLGQVTGTPHTCGVMTDISRKLMKQSTPDAEQMVSNDIIREIAQTIQIAVFAGGGGDDPSAITNASGINNPTISSAGTPTYAEILNFPGDVFGDNAGGGNMKFCMTSEVWAKLAATDVSTSTGQFVVDYKSQTCIGYPYLMCNDLPANSLWFGDWSTVNVGIWGAGVDMIVDTATLSSQGGIRLVGLQDVDVMVRLGQKLAYNTAVTS